MSNTTQTKYCPRCKQIKPVSQFHKNKSRHDGYVGYCIFCANQYLRKYMKSEEQKEKRYIRSKKYVNTPKGRENKRKSTRKYHKSKKGKIAVLKYLKSEKGKIFIKRNHEKYPIRRKARTKIANEIAKGNFPNIKTQICKCGKQAEHYHHYLGYKPNHWLDVVPLCQDCHFMEHKLS